jgi:ATP adenylyltransferase
MSYLFNTSKRDYVTKEKKRDGCILCAVRDGSNGVESLELFRDSWSFITLNLFPHNAGHLLIVPLRHVTDYLELTDEELLSITNLTRKSLRILNDYFSPAGYNMGYNLGEGSGASIDHIHMQLVPRYRNEIGFLEVLSGTRISVHNPMDVFEDLKSLFHNDDIKNNMYL